MDNADVNMQKQNKSHGRRKLLRFFVILTIIVIITAFGAAFSYRFVLENLGEDRMIEEVEIAPGEALTIDIPMGTGTSGIAEILKSEGLIRYPLVFRLMSAVYGYDGRYKAGSHMVKDGLGYEQYMSLLIKDPLNEPSIKVMIPEYFTYEQTVERLEKEGLIDTDKFNEVAGKGEFDYKFLQGIPNRTNKLEGYLFPETYNFDVDSDEEAVLKKLLDQFNKEFKPEYYERAKQLGMTIDQVITLASIIEREAKVADERKTVSGVFHNRLKKNMRLESCATVEYILFKRDGKIKDALTNEDTSIDDPYNTYRNAGLPPGPICSPGIASIEAALYPEEHNYYFFVVKKDGGGTHEFTSTLNEHNKAVSRNR